MGFHGGANLWFNDYSKKMVGPGGEVAVRYGISRAFSAGLLMGYEELKSKEENPIPGVSYQYLKLHAMPASFVGWFHLAPGKAVNPYVYVGVGAMIYKRLNGASDYISDSKFRTSIHVPVGVGLEVFVSKGASFIVDLGYRATDDYPDAIKKGKIDGYATGKVGVNFYFGTSNSEKEELAKMEAQRVRDSTEAAARRLKDLADAEAQRLKALAEAEALRIKDSTEAAARHLAELNAHRPVDTVIVLERGKTVILKGVNFAFNKATLTEDSKTILERALAALRASPELNVLIVGHTDNVGSAEYNKKLSLRRSQAVKAWMEAKGIPAKRLTVAGKGFDEPIDVNTSDEGRANNRRIEFRVLK
jgi:outer membrane protein OmpA-like peptidoglycan-associated protein